jgi:hypothetical protein
MGLSSKDKYYEYTAVRTEDPILTLADDQYETVTYKPNPQVITTQIHGYRGQCGDCSTKQVHSQVWRRKPPQNFSSSLKVA